jgi:hypothetical protein
LFTPAQVLVPPSPELASTSNTRAPCRAAAMAAPKPPLPAPTTQTSK